MDTDAPDRGRPTGARAVTLLAVGLLLAATPALWGTATSVGSAGAGVRADPRTHAAVLLVVVTGGGALLLLAVLALVVVRERAARLVDAAVLAVGGALAAATLVIRPGRSDEGLLTDQAATALLHGHPVYGVPWPFLFTSGVALTPTMSGGADTTYAYPPGAVLLVAGFRAAVGHAAVAPAVVCTVALLAAVVGGWLLVPAPWRSAVTAAGFGIPVLAEDARAGYPAVIALALLVPVVAAWHRTGAGGRLGPAGFARAAAAGAACAVHQTAWFLLPFVLAGVWSLRRPEVGGVRALATAARYAAVAALVWLAVDLPFVLTQPRAWAHGLLLPLTQHAIVHGQGLVDVTQFLTAGSGAVAGYGWAQLALLLALLVLLVLFPGRLAAALPVLPAVTYFVGSRSSADYFLLVVPLWVVTALTVPSPLPGAEPSWPLGRRVRPVLVGALLVPALACAVVAAATPSPLLVRMGALPIAHRAVVAATVLVRNEGTVPLTPHFLARVGTHPSRFWRVRSGPATVAPGGSARFVLLPDGRAGARAVAAAGSRAVLMIVTGAPLTVTNVPFRSGAAVR